MKVTPQAFIKKYLQKIVRIRDFDAYQLSKKFKECPFLTYENKCSIHDAKPIQCARGPYGFFYQKGVYNYDCMKHINDENWTSDHFDSEIIDLIKREKNVKSTSNVDKKIDPEI